MNQYFCMMGKSASGKDTIYEALKKQMQIQTYIPYTTRPMRTGEAEGNPYHFVSIQQMEQWEKEGKVIEIRKYNTVEGVWMYATIADKQWEANRDMLTVGTLESYEKMLSYFEKSGTWRLVPIYIEIPEEERRKRALAREMAQEHPKIEEMKRRLEADNQDFTEEKIKSLGITKEARFQNLDLDTCVKQIRQYIEERQKTPHEKFKQEYVYSVKNIPPQVQGKQKALQERGKVELEKE